MRFKWLFLYQQLVAYVARHIPERYTILPAFRLRGHTVHNLPLASLIHLSTPAGPIFVAQISLENLPCPTLR
jgi:hypothetical protein